MSKTTLAVREPPKDPGAAERKRVQRRREKLQLEEKLRLEVFTAGIVVEKLARSARLRGYPVGDTSTVSDLAACVDMVINELLDTDPLCNAHYKTYAESHRDLDNVTEPPQGSDR